MTFLISPGQPICGVSPKLIKIVANTLWELRSAQLYDLAVVLGAPKEVVCDLWNVFIKSGLIVQAENGHYYPTDLMFKLATGRVGKPLPRATANKLVEEFINRAERTNKDGQAMYFVTRIEVFGSYLDSEKTDLGDLDVAWEVLEKPEFRNRIGNMRCVNLDPLSHMRRLVRPRNNAIRMISVGELENLKCPRKLIYEFNGPPVLAAIAARKKQIEDAAASVASMQASLRSLFGLTATK